MAVFLPRFHEDVLWGDEAVGDEPPEPMRDVDDVIVKFFLVHGGHNLANPGID